MKYVLKLGFMLLILFILTGCKFVFNKKTLQLENGNHATRILIIDSNNNKIEYNIEPRWTHIWFEDLIGDFNFIYINTENTLEGIFIISNKYKNKKLPYDIIMRSEYDKKHIEEYDTKEILLSYDVNIRITEDSFELEYNETKFSILAYFSYDDDYIFYREKYFKEYNLEFNNLFLDFS